MTDRKRVMKCDWSYGKFVHYSLENKLWIKNVSINFLILLCKIEGIKLAQFLLDNYILIYVYLYFSY